MADGDRVKEEGTVAGEGGKARRGRRLPSIFDGLPPGPVDMAVLYELMESDTETRVLEVLRRAQARHVPTAGLSPTDR